MQEEEKREKKLEKRKQEEENTSSCIYTDIVSFVSQRWWHKCFRTLWTFCWACWTETACLRCRATPPKLPANLMWSSCARKAIGPLATTQINWRAKRNSLCACKVCTYKHSHAPSRAAYLWCGVYARARLSASSDAVRMQGSYILFKDVLKCICVRVCGHVFVVRTQGYRPASADPNHQTAHTNAHAHTHTHACFVILVLQLLFVVVSSRCHCFLRRDAADRSGPRRWPRARWPSTRVAMARTHGQYETSAHHRGAAFHLFGSCWLQTESSVRSSICKVCAIFTRGLAGAPASRHHTRGKGPIGDVGWHLWESQRSHSWTRGTCFLKLVFVLKFLCYYLFILYFLYLKNAFSHYWTRAACFL